MRAIFNLLPGDLDSGMVIASKDQLLELGGAGDVGAFTNVDENGGCLLGHCSFLPPLPLTRRRLGEGTEPLDGWFETREISSLRPFLLKEKEPSLCRDIHRLQSREPRHHWRMRNRSEERRVGKECVRTCRS